MQSVRQDQSELSSLKLSNLSRAQLLGGVRPSLCGVRPSLCLGVLAQVCPESSALVPERHKALPGSKYRTATGRNSDVTDYRQLAQVSIQAERIGSDLKTTPLPHCHFSDQRSYKYSAAPPIVHQRCGLLV